MLATIGFIAIFSAMFIVFSDEWMDYVRSMMKKPFVFQACLLVLASMVVLLCKRSVILMILYYWIGIHEVALWFSAHIGFLSGAPALVESMVLAIIALMPLVVVSLLMSWKKTLSYLQEWGYMTSLGLWLVTVFLYTFHN